MGGGISKGDFFVGIFCAGDKFQGAMFGKVYSREIFSVGEVVFQGGREVNAYSHCSP